MKKMRGLVVAVAALVVVGACGRVPQAAPPSGYTLYEAVSANFAQFVAVIGSRSHTVEGRLPLGTPSADWHHYYAVSGTRLLDIDPRTDTTLRAVSLPGRYELPPANISGTPGGLSPNGRWLVLRYFDRDVDGAPLASHLLIVNTSFTGPAVPLTLDGYFEFDAISNDGERLFLIQHIGGGLYHVRVYYMSQHLLDPSFVIDKKDGSEAMSGLRLAGVPSQDGSWLFSVYARQHAGAFIHALYLDGPIAFCIDLPGTGYADGSDASLHWSLALSPDGSILYATNGAMGVVAGLGTGLNRPPAVVRTGNLGDHAPGTGGAASAPGSEGAALSPDGRSLAMAAGSGLLWIDTSSFQPTGRGLSSWNVQSLALSPNGSVLYALGASGAIAELSVAGGAVSATFDPTVGQPMALMHVDAVQ